MVVEAAHLWKQVDLLRRGGVRLGDFRLQGHHTLEPLLVRKQQCADLHARQSMHET